MYYVHCEIFVGFWIVTAVWILKSESTGWNSICGFSSLARVWVLL